MMRVTEAKPNPKGSQGRQPAGRSGRPIGTVSEANSREMRKMVPLAGIEPALLAELDFERAIQRYSKLRRLQVKARKPTTINDLS